MIKKSSLTATKFCWLVVLKLVVREYIGVVPILKISNVPAHPFAARSCDLMVVPVFFFFPFPLSID